MLEANTMLINKLKQEPNEDARQALITDYLNPKYHIIENYIGADRLEILANSYAIPFWREDDVDMVDSIDFAILAANDNSTIKEGFADFESARTYLLKETGLFAYWNKK